MARALRASSALVVVAALFAAAPARAWTDAAVRSVQARVELRPDASARITLTATVRVHGGWLEGLELAGLDPDLVLDETAPPFALDAEGQRYEPRAEVLAGGRVLLAFGRRGAPRRGTITVTIAYTTSLAHRATEPLEDEGLVRVRWTLPGWRSGLDGVQIEIVAPRGTRFGPRDESDTGASVATERTPATNLFGAAYAGDYFFADFVAGWIYRLDVPLAGGAYAFARTGGNPSGLVVGPDGALYVLLGTRVDRIAP